MKTLILFLLLLSNKTSSANNTGENSHSPVSYGVELPAWILENGYIGISDPISDSLVAYNQAVQRALAFYTISSDMSASIVYEYYFLNANKELKKQDNQKSHWIAEFDSSVDKISYTVERVHRTKSNETIVLLNIKESKDGNTAVDVAGSFLYHYEYFNSSLIYGEKQVLKVNSTDSIKSSEWNSTVGNAKYIKKSIFDEYENILKKRITSYGDFGTVTDEMVFSNTEFGLWNSFIDTFFQAVSIFESKDVVVKNTTRQILQENQGVYEYKTQDISRLVMKTNLSCRVSGISMKDNNLYAVWEIIEK